MADPVTSPPESESRAQRLAWRGYALMGVAVVMLGAVKEVAAEGDHPGVWSFLLVIGGIGVAVVVGLVGRHWSMSARKLRAASSAQQLDLTSARPVVYLRTFTDDQKVADAHVAQGFFQLQTEEEQLARVLDRIGPFVALGDPADSLPDLGAARVYVTDDQWQGRVRELVGKARLVVLRLATTEAVRWEIQLVVSSLGPERLVLVVPKGRRRYRSVKAACDEYLRSPLPDLPLKPVGLWSIGGIVRFEPDWTPSFVPRARIRWLRASFQAPLEQRLLYMLRPVFEQVGAEWTKPPMRLLSPAGAIAGIAMAGTLYQGGLAVARLIG